MTTKKQISSILVASFLTVTAQHSYSAIIFGSDFESGFTGGWSTTTSAQSTITTDSGAQSPIGAGSLGARLVRGADLAGPQGTAPIAFLNNANLNGVAGGVTTNITYLQFEAKFAPGTVNPAMFLGNTIGNAAAADQATILHLRDAGGDIAYRTSSSFVKTDTGMNIADDTWYRYTLTLNLATDTFDLRLQTMESFDVDTTFSGLAFRSTQDNLDSLRFAFNQGTGTGVVGSFDVDNVIFSDSAGDLNFTQIPEPTSALLGGLGLLFLLRRRRA